MQGELEQLPGGAGAAAMAGPDGEQQALRVLMMAQRTADDHVSDARREADKVLSEARTKAEEVTRDARAKADALERDARQRHQEATSGLDAKRTALQQHIDTLKQFEGVLHAPEGGWRAGFATLKAAARPWRPRSAGARKAVRPPAPAVRPPPRAPAPASTPGRPGRRACAVLSLLVVASPATRRGAAVTAQP